MKEYQAIDFEALFEKLPRDTAFTFIVKKVAETRTKRDRLRAVNGLMRFLDKKQLDEKQKAICSKRKTA